MTNPDPRACVCLPWVLGISSSVFRGFMMNVATVAYANFFGRAHLGAISGYSSALVVFGSACGQ